MLGSQAYVQGVGEEIGGLLVQVVIGWVEGFVCFFDQSEGLMGEFVGEGVCIMG
jgi:hypothetical protein